MTEDVRLSADIKIDFQANPLDPYTPDVEITTAPEDADPVSVVLSFEEFRAVVIALQGVIDNRDRAFRKAQRQGLRARVARLFTWAGKCPRS
jgi:ABC-type branched-subunit amino acid transport system substrate-binding protein